MNRSSNHTTSENDVIDIEQLALIIRRARATISTEMTRNPTNLPPWFKLPGSRRPLWLRSTVYEFIQTAANHADALPKSNVRGAK